MKTFNELLAAAKELSKFAKTAPGRLPSDVQDAIGTIAAAERELQQPKSDKLKAAIERYITADWLQSDQATACWPAYEFSRQAIYDAYVLAAAYIEGLQDARVHPRTDARDATDRDRDAAQTPRGSTANSRGAEGPSPASES